jgi:enoyl-CoA hydratase
MPDKKKYNYIDYQIKYRIATVIVNRPPMNAMNDLLRSQLEVVFEKLDSLNEVGVIILTGGGEKAFIAGADIQTISDMNKEDGYELSVSTQRILLKIERSKKIVIAAINGLALGGGCEVALACDMRVADESALFGFPEVKLGLFPGAGGTQRLARFVGIGKAKELIFTGDFIEANEAKAIGLVERIAPKGKVIEDTTKIAKKILQRGPQAVENAKKALNASIELDFEEGQKLEAQLFSDLFKTHDLIEGVTAFMEKRNPRFSGN